MNSFIDPVSKYVHHRGQVDVIDMPVQLTSDYKYFLVYEDQISKFIVLEGLHGNTASEVALKLLDILAIIGAPQVLQSSNGRKFAEEVVQKLRLLWKDFVILHGEIAKKNGQSRDFKTLLESWIEENPTRTENEALKYIQIFQNSTFRCEDGKIPYDILFGKNVHEEFKKNSSIINLKENIWREEDWISLFSNKKENEQLVKDSTFTNTKDVTGSLETRDCESGDCYSDGRDESQSDTTGFNFVDVKNESSNAHSEDLLFEDEYNIDDKSWGAEEKLDLRCSICDKRYIKAGHLRNHMTIHMTKKNFKCTKCNKSFHVLSLYEKHVRQSHRQSKSIISTRSRSSKDSQNESTLNTKESELNCSLDLNLDENTEANDTQTLTKNSRLLEKRKISTDNCSIKMNGEQALTCSYCNQRFNFPSVLKRHMRKHTNERPYICKICSKRFKQLGHLSQHAVTHKGYKTFHCAICGVKCESMASMKIHAQSHKEDFLKTKDNFRLFECDTCKKVFTTKGVLERHILTHTHERLFPCTICGKRFKQAGHVKSHMLVHTGERRFECTICKKRFTLSNTLKKHMYVHNGEKPYQCDVCGARFLEKRNLNGHLLTHTNERPFRCKICGKRYTLADTLRRHISAAHEDGRTYQCEICAKMFKQLAHLSVHKKVHNDERPFQCHLCEKNFKHKNVLKSHLAIHANVRPFECDECKATFVRKTNLQTHIASAHMNERPYVCNICGKRFKQVSHLNGHVVVHSNLMPYQCDFCDRRCNRLDNLKKHMRLHTKSKE